MINQESWPGDGLKKVPEPFRETTGTREEIECSANETDPVERTVAPTTSFVTVAAAILTHFY